MKYILNLFFWLSLLFCSCSGGSGADAVSNLIARIDSLKEENARQTSTLQAYKDAVETINATLDTIAVQEKMIFVRSDELPVTRDDVLANLERYEMALRGQQNKVRLLENALSTSNDSLNSAKQLIEHLYVQIATKNTQISQLKAELANKNVNIARLQEQVESQRITLEEKDATISELSRRNQRQGEALARQDAMLNNGYVLIGTKDDLKHKGVIKKGKIVSDAFLDRSKFAKVDIRNWREISFKAKKPKILTNMPSNSYVLTTDGNKNFTLKIENPSDFWRISNYLIIQTD